MRARHIRSNTSRRNVCLRVLAGLALTAAGLAVVSSPQTAPARATSGVTLMPRAGQFAPLPGTVAASLSSGFIDSTGHPVTSIVKGSTYHFSVSNVGVPLGASSVALEFIARAGYNGGVVAGDSANTIDTSMTWPASVTRYGFDTVKMDAAGFIYVRTFANGSNTDLTTSTMTVRVHGYYTSSSAAQAASTYVGLQPTLLYDSATTNNAAIGPSGNRPMPSDSSIQVTGYAGVPSDGSVTSVAIQTVVAAPPCTGGFGVYPDGASRSDWDGGFISGYDDANFDLVQLSTAGKIDLHVGSPIGSCPSGSTVEVRVFIRGYFTSPSFSAPGATYAPVQQAVLDTTVGVGTMEAPLSTGCSTTSPIPAHGGCTFKVSGVGSIPASGIAGVGAQILAIGNNANGSLALSSSSSGSKAASDDYAPTSSSGRYSNFEMTTYTSLSHGDLYIYNVGDVAVDVRILVHGYNVAPTAPAAPSAVTASVTDGYATVHWNPPTNDGGAALTEYIVTSDDGWTNSVDAPATSAAFTGFALGGSRTFTVSAANEVGASTSSTPSGATAAPSPASPLNMSPGGGSQAEVQIVPTLTPSLSATVRTAATSANTTFELHAVDGSLVTSGDGSPVGPWHQSVFAVTDGHLAEKTTYQWTARTCDPGGTCSAWTPPTWFTTDTAASMPASDPGAPADGDAGCSMVPVDDPLDAPGSASDTFTDCGADDNDEDVQPSPYRQLSAFVTLASPPPADEHVVLVDGSTTSSTVGSWIGRGLIESRFTSDRRAQVQVSATLKDATGTTLDSPSTTVALPLSPEETAPFVVTSSVDAATVASVTYVVSDGISDSGSSFTGSAIEAPELASGSRQPVDFGNYIDPAAGSMPYVLPITVYYDGLDAAANPLITVAWINDDGSVAYVATAKPVDAAGRIVTNMTPGTAMDAYVVVSDPTAPNLAALNHLTWESIS